MRCTMAPSLMWTRKLTGRIGSTLEQQDIFILTKASQLLKPVVGVLAEGGGSQMSNFAPDLAPVPLCVSASIQNLRPAVPVGGSG